MKEFEEPGWISERDGFPSEVGGLNSEFSPQNSEFKAAYVEGCLAGSDRSYLVSWFISTYLGHEIKLFRGEVIHLTKYQQDIPVPVGISYIHGYDAISNW